MGGRSKVERHLVKFPRLREIRERKLGWDIVDLVSRLQNRPSIASIYRLEQGTGIKPSSARRVFDLINRELNGKLDPDKELVFDKSPHRARQ